MQRGKQANGACSAANTVVVQAELLQQEIINRQRLSVAAGRLLDDLPKQAQAAEDRMFMAEYVRGYQLVSWLQFSPMSCHSSVRSPLPSASMIRMYTFSCTCRMLMTACHLHFLCACLGQKRLVLTNALHVSSPNSLMVAYLYLLLSLSHRTYLPCAPLLPSRHTAGPVTTETHGGSIHLPGISICLRHHEEYQTYYPQVKAQ